MSLPPATGARTRGDVLITGATGFLGMELVARLLEDTDRRVWGWCEPPARRRRVPGTGCSRPLER